MPNLKMPLLAISLAVASLFTPYSASAAALPAGMEKVTTTEGISEYRLPNGFKVLLMPDQSKANIVTNMTYLVGSRHENAGQTGYAHLLEHMLCKGSKNYPQISRQMSSKAVYWNAFTSFDHTNFITSFEASDKELAWVLGLEADRMQNTLVQKSELDTEMTVVRNELEIKDNDAHELLLKRVLAVAYDWHGYGHATIGERSDIENVNIEQLNQLYHTYYRPDNAVLLVAGKFDPEAALQTISRRFGTILAPTTHLPPIPTIEPAQQGERQVLLRTKASSNVLMLAYHRPSILHPDFAALKIAGLMLASGREQRNAGNEIFLANMAPGFYMPGSAANGLAMFSTSNIAGSTNEESAKNLIKAVETFGQNTLSQNELDFIKNRYANQFSVLINEPFSLAMALNEYIAAGDWRLLFLEKDRIARLDTEQVQNAARRYFVRDNRTTGMLLSEKNKSQDTSIPTSPPLAEVMKKFVHRDEYAPVAEFNTAPANILQQTHRLKIGHIEAALLSKPSRGQEVAVELILHWGDEKSLLNKRWIERMTSKLLINGVSQYGKETLQAEREKAHIRGAVTKFTTDRAHLAQALQLMMLNLKEPSLAQVYPSKNEEVMTVQQTRDTPLQMANDELAKQFNAYPMGDIRALETSQQIISELNAIKAGDVMDFHKQFYGASNGHLSIVGDFDVDEATAVLDKELSGWESKSTYQPAHYQIAERPPLNKFIDTPSRDNGYFIARVDLALSSSNADYLALYVANYLIGGHTIDSRLGKRIRVKEGWSYGINSTINGHDTDPVSNWQITATAASANISKLKPAILEELQLVLSKGFTQEELSLAKQYLAHQSQQSRNSNMTLAEQWNRVMHLDQDYSWYAKREAQLQSLTLEQLNQVTRKYLQPAQWSIVTTGDSNKMDKAH